MQFGANRASTSCRFLSPRKKPLALPDQRANHIGSCFVPARKKRQSDKCFPLTPKQKNLSQVLFQQEMNWVTGCHASHSAFPQQGKNYFGDTPFCPVKGKTIQPISRFARSTGKPKLKFFYACLPPLFSAMRWLLVLLQQKANRSLVFTNAVSLHQKENSTRVFHFGKKETSMGRVGVLFLPGKEKTATVLST